MLFAPRPKGLGKDNFLKLADKEEVTGMFRGEPYTYRRHWVQGRGAECSGEGCQYCAAPPDLDEKGRNKNAPTFRFRINFVTSKDGQFVAKIFEGGGELYDDLVNLDKKFDLSKVVVDLSRSGMKQNTKYRVLPRADMPVTKEILDKINAVQLLPLSAAEASEDGAA
jgi:hypothetical protein